MLIKFKCGQVAKVCISIKKEDGKYLKIKAALINESFLYENEEPFNFFELGYVQELIGGVIKRLKTCSYEDLLKSPIILGISLPSEERRVKEWLTN